ncbi:hypothetical protein F4818DRAFT_436811 [Hypoxylon cercidicola]|nr:hypothetical protein F4818DRAFT_436811 [Hypoxylon cercidicola]
MSPPTERFRKLSLESMPPTTRLQSRLQQVEVEVEVEAEEDSSSSSSSSDAGSEPDFDVDEDGDHMVSPSRLKYSLDLLDDDTRENIIKATEVPSQFVLRGCQAGEERCLFLITEPVEYTVRTGSQESGYGVPSCTCEDGSRGGSPCRHMLWLFDQITSQILGAAQEGPLRLTRHGYAAELGNPYDAIADFHLDTLADSLHCGVVGPSADPSPSPRRAREACELLASLHGAPADGYRPDLLGEGAGTGGRGRAVARGDLEQTVFRMLLRSDDFFHYFLSALSARPGERNEARFRGLLLRADAALAGLRRYADDPPPLQTVARPKDVAWCASHLEAVTRQIRAVIHTTDRPLERRELRAAARTAVHVLEQVVMHHDRDVGPADLPSDRRNLYRRLIGSRDDDDDNDSDSDFVVDVLASIPPEVLSPWVDDLAAVERRIAEKGAPAAYLARLRSLLGHLRSRSPGAGSKRGGQAQTQDRRAKRAR